MTGRCRVGYYVHHHGRGHLQQAQAVAAELAGRGVEVTGLSSLPRPADWPGRWVDLPRDDTAQDVLDPTAGGRLHWVPLRDAGLRGRMAALAGWVADRDPAAVVVDVSVEVCLLARLLGVPTVPVLLPGDRGDAAHLLALETATRVLGFWPAGLEPPVRGVPTAVLDRVAAVGAIGGPVTSAAPPAGRRRVALLSGAGGTTVTADAVHAAAAASTWDWHVLGPPGPWVDDVGSCLAAADVVVTHAGMAALADVAAARRPAVVVPQPRPHGEQHATAAALAAGDWPCLVVDEGFVGQDWDRLLDETASLDGERWRGWNDGHAAVRAADVVLDVAAGRW